METLMKNIVVNEEKCTACLTCEVACSLHNAKEINPRKSMIRVRIEGDRYIPVIAGPGKDEENTLRHMFFDEGVECNLCLSCVKWCASGALAATDV
jgi:Fe-S-cluster-containing dehydrogenase component